MTATVVGSTEPATQVAAGSPEREQTPAAARTLHPEAVVFPRDGKPLDRRPVQLRRQQADARYREDGRPRKR